MSILKKMNFLISAFPLILGSVLGLSGTDKLWAQSTSEPIKVGVILSLTGAAAGLGVPERNGILLAEKTINAKGGVGGRQIKFIVEDDTSNPDTALFKANDLVFSQKVVAMIATSQTAATVAVGGVTDPLKLPQIALSGLGPAIERERKCTFHILPPQLLNAQAMLEYARSINARKIGVLHDAGYGSVVMAVLNTIAADYGIEFTTVEKFEIGATDTLTQAAKVRASNPDAVMVISTNGAPFRAVKQIQMNKPVIAAIGTASYQYVTAMGTAADNIVHPEFLVGEDPLDSQKEFVSLYKAQYGALPKNFEAAGWDAANLIAQSLAKVGPGAPAAKLCESMRGPFTGVMAAYDFSAADLTGIKVQSFIYSKLVEGKFTRIPFRVR